MIVFPLLSPLSISFFLTDVGVLVANVDDLDSIEQMCVAAKLLINCVGPVNFHFDQKILLARIFICMIYLLIFFI